MIANADTYEGGSKKGKVKEKMLLSKMLSILTPNNERTSSRESTNITFENLIIFLAAVSNIEIPYKDSVKKEISNRKDIRQFNDDFMKNTSSSNGLSLEGEILNDPQFEIKMSHSNLLNLLPKSTKNSKLSIQKSKHKYGYFNEN
jgi:hypothetical protein